ncbi:diaminopimelate decarboxylase [Lachnospiraceae bacterium oral taxon 096]|jgi:diaminopimelate decarboxylase|nr:diaminopimelate decarboxylase [Lachnospiraceae bacterium oral taxon 096]QUI96454.1 diaminopimelate decarboxylase [Lachnospiraceae bacterium oral taxon 096]RKW33911.1 MAG: diaminopimelate decarboxylase [Lachnoanaerobaculum sp.]
MSNLREIKNNKLYFDGCDTTELAKKYGTPIYVMSQNGIEERINELKEQFTNKYPRTRIAYASKAFCTEGMYAILKKAGVCIDVVSGGEIYAAKQAGFPAEHVEFNGNNKLPKEIDAAVEYGVGRIIVDGLQELPLIIESCKKYKKKMNIMIRITPGVAASTHDFIVTGKKDSKFGIPLEKEIFLPIVKQILDSEYLEFTGLHMHIGSQLFENDAFLKALDVLMDWAALIKTEFNADVKEVNFGGGYGAEYTTEERKPYSFFLDPMMELLEKRSKAIGIERPEAVIEPGRSIVAEAGITLYTIGQIKEIPGIRKYVSVDGGMGDNIRVALYQAEYEGIVANRAQEPKDDKVSICGKYCESGDIIMTDIMVPKSVKMGDIFATYSTGAYGYVMASNYNNNPIPGVVLVKGGKSAWMVKPQTYEQIVQNNEIPDFI